MEGDGKALLPERSRTGASTLGSAEPLSAAASRGALLDGGGAAHPSLALGPVGAHLCAESLRSRPHFSRHGSPAVMEKRGQRREETEQQAGGVTEGPPARLLSCSRPSPPRSLPRPLAGEKPEEARAVGSAVGGERGREGELRRCTEKRGERPGKACSLVARVEDTGVREVMGTAAPWSLPRCGGCLRA